MESPATSEATASPSVTMIGLGDMGSALARAFVGGGHAVTVWNRTRQRSESLAEMGAVVAATAADAVAASDVVVVCVAGYEASHEVLGAPEVAHLLPGKVVVQLGNGVPTDVQAAQQWFLDQGVKYLDGSIMAYPDHIGTADCKILVSGDPAAFDVCCRLFDCLGGDVRFLGDDPVTSAVVNSSALGFLYVAAHAFLSSAALCQASGGPVDALVDVLGTWLPGMPAMFGEYGRMIEARTYDGAGLGLGTGAENLEAILEYGTSVGVDTSLFASAHRSFEAATSCGHGPDLAALFETLRRAD
jgi:3-hydroxyisobutyrate dehydrogenase-like beta-hydroxyacid dehydrogenase